MYRMKKAFALILALIMVCSLASTSVRADEEDISETAVESVIEKNNVEETVDEEVEEELEPEVEGESSTVESDEKPAVSEAVQGVTVESITVEENSVDETPSEEKSFDEITETPKKSGSGRSSETYVLTAGEELHIPYIKGLETVRASFVPETNGYYNFTYSAGSNMTVSQLSVLNSEENVYTYYDVASMAYGYTALQDVYLTVGHMYYFEAKYYGTEVGSETDYLRLSVDISNNTRSCGDGVFWDLTEDGTLSISGNGPMRDFEKRWENGVIHSSDNPWSYKTVNQVIITPNVTYIGDCAFSDRATLTKVTIPDSVTAIGEYAFSGCTSLTSVTIPNSVTSLGAHIFEACPLLVPINYYGTEEEWNSISGGAYSNIVSLVVESWEFPYIQDAETVRVSFVPENSGYYNFSYTKGNNMALVSLSVLNAEEYVYVNYDASSMEPDVNAGLDLVYPLCNVYLTAGQTYYYEAEYTSTAVGNEIDCLVLAVGFSVNDRRCGENMYWNLSEDRTLTISGTGNWYYYGKFPWCYKNVNHVVIEPGITSIQERAFADCSSLLSVSISDSVTNIGWKAFYNCSALTEVEIPDSVTSIGESAFTGCTALTRVEIPNSVTTIGNNTFSRCSALTEVEIPDSVTTVGPGAFQFCSSLVSIYIGASVTTIGDYAFGSCPVSTIVLSKRLRAIPSGLPIGYSLSNIYYLGTYSEWTAIANSTEQMKDLVLCIDDFGFCGDEDNIKWMVQNNVLYITGSGSIPSFNNNPAPWRSYASVISEVVIDSEITSIGSDAFTRFKANVTYYYLGDSTPLCDDSHASSSDLVKATDFGMQTNTSWILVGDTLKIYGTGPSPSMEYCNHKEDIVYVEISDSITEIRNNAFSGCNSLTNIEIPDNVTVIGDRAFLGCSALTSVSILGSVTSIGVDAFKECSELSGLTLPDSITSISVGSFYGCSSITDFTIPNSVNSIGESAFIYCSSLTNIVIPDSVISIGPYAFFGCSSLASVTIPNSVNLIGDYAFCYCTELETVVIPHGVTIIPDGAFKFCNLTSVTISESVVSIGNDAFASCDSLTDVYYDGTEDRWTVINMGYGNEVLTSDATTIHFGKTSESGACGDNLNWELVEGALSINGTGPMWDYTAEAKPRWSATTVSAIVISEGATSIGNAAFSDCSLLTVAVLPESINVIGNRAFSRCTSLESITLPSGLETIDSFAFQNCRSITSLALPESLTSIGTSAFAGCIGLRTVSIPGTIDVIPNQVFEVCTGLQTVTIEEGITAIGEDVFSNCSAVTTVYLPVSLTSVGEYSFDGCNSLTDVYYAGSQIDWQNMVIAEGNDPLLQAEIHYAIDDTVYDAAYAESFIDAIPSLDQLTLEDKSVVEAAREAYDKIPSDEQANVDAEKLAKLTAAEERIAQLEAEASRFYVVTVTSSGDGISSSIAPVYGGGSYHAGETVTVGASIVSGFTFIGWTVNGITVSTEPEYTFTVESDTDLVAAYQIKNEVTYSLKITGVDFKINGIPQNNSYHESFASGTEVELCYYGSDTFLRWENTSNQPQSIEPTITLTMNRNYELKVITVRGIPGDDTNGYYAYVEFISPYDQVMSASTWSSKDSYLSHALPGSVSKSGYSFAGWTMDGENAAGTRDIIAGIDASHSYISLTALMEVLDTPRIVTVFDAEGNTTEKQVNLGKTVTLKAGTVSGKTFKCWALDAQGNIPLSYSAAYSFKVTTDISVYAIYVNAGESVTALPVAASTGVYAFTDGGKNKLSFTGNFDVPDGYTVVEYGLLYGTKASEFTDAETADQKLVYGSENTYVKQQASTFRLKRDSYEYLINVTGYLNNYVYAKAYLVVINSSTGEQEVHYGRLMYGTYNNLSSSGS